MAAFYRSFCYDVPLKLRAGNSDMIKEMSKSVAGNLRPFMLLLLAFLLTACGEQGADQSRTQITISNIERDSNLAAGDATFQDLDGNPLELADFHGHRVVINYWATWCAPCIEELPALSRAATALSAENYLFLLASDEPLATIERFLEDRGFSGNFIKLNTFFGIHGIEAVPSTVLYDEDGQELASWLGAYEWDSPAMLEQLRNPATATQTLPL